MAHDTAIVLHPAVSFYRRLLAHLRYELREVLSQWVVLMTEERPRLLDRYAELFGALERELQEVTLRAAQVQRLCEIVHTYYRRGEPITDELLRRICQLVKVEFLRYTEGSSLPHTPLHGHSTTQLFSGQASDEPAGRSKQLVQLYRDLVKRLHPDREGDPDLFERFWHMVQEAYARGDGERLRVVHGIVCIEAQYSDACGYTLEALERAYRRLVFRLDYERRRLDRTRGQEPLAIAKQMDDPNWVAQRQQQLTEQIERQRRLATLAIEELSRCGASNWEEHFRNTTIERLPNDLFQEEFLKHTYFSSMQTR